MDAVLERHFVCFKGTFPAADQTLQTRGLGVSLQRQVVWNVKDADRMVVTKVTLTKPISYYEKKETTTTTTTSP